MSNDRFSTINDKFNRLDGDEKKALLAKLKSGLSHSKSKGSAIPVEDLSRAQKRLWIIDQLSRCSYLYHVPVILPLSKKVDISALKTAFQCLIKDHQLLANYFIVDNDGVRQCHNSLCDVECRAKMIMSP